MDELLGGSLDRFHGSRTKEIAKTLSNPKNLPVKTEELTIPVDELRLRVTPEDPERSDSGFMNMEGETELWVEAHSKVPLEISGKVPKVPGRVVIRLSGLR